MKHALGDTGTAMCLILKKGFQITSELSAAMLKKQRSEKKGPPSNIWTTTSIGTAKEVVIRQKKKVELEPI